MSMDQTHFIIVSSPQPTSFNLNSQVLTSVSPVSHTSQIITTQNRISLPIINENVNVCEAPQIFTIPSMECGTQLSLVSNDVVVPVQQIPTGQTIILRSPIQTTIPIKQVATNRIVFTPEQLGMSKENYYVSNVNGNISTNENLNSNARTVLTFVTPDGEEKDVAFNGTPETINIPYVLYEFCKSSGFEDTMEGHMDCEPEEVQKQRKEQAQEVYKKLEQQVIAESTVASDKENQKNTPAKVHICHFCNGEMKDDKKCMVCKRSMPRFTTKVDLNKITEAQKVKFVILQTNPKLADFKKRRCTRKHKKNDAPVCLTISSDEEEEENGEKENGSSISNEEIELSLSKKEPIITEFTEAPHRERIEGGGVDITELLDSNVTENALLQCRTVRIGSYKVVPKNKVTVNEYGLKFDVPDLNGERTTIKLLRTEIVKVLANFNKTTPCLFYYLTNSAGVKVRNALKMPHKPDTLYFDPTSTVEKYRRVTFLPENISEDKRLFIKSIYDKQSLLDELSDKEANDILVKTSPQENIQASNSPITRSKTLTPRGSQTSITSTAAGIQTIMVYPPPPMKNGISINTEDYGCLGEDQYLNDIIIDFYLKWFFLTNLSPEDQKRTHIFSSFFYKRLTQKAPAKGGNKYQDDPKLSPAERRHARVKGWTKSVDLFSKDFIIIPINEHSHWFLGIICFPGLSGPVRFSDNAPVKVLPKKVAPKFVGSTTITVVKPEPPIVVETDEDEEEKDEAEADEDEIEPNSSEDEEKNSEELLDDATPRMPRRSKIDGDEPIKQPCILIFDSLAGASRARVCATLREYLQVEYSLKHKGQERDFSKNTFKGAVPKVPQQTNYTDCGLYVLQFVEAFFNKPITNYKMPIKGIKDWFPAADIESQKRYEIQQLLHSLMEEQNVDVSRLNLPELNLHHGGHLGLVDYSDGEELDDLPVEEEELGEEEMMEVEEEESFQEEDSIEDVEPEIVATKVFARPKQDFPVINKINKQPNLSNLNQISISRSSNSLPPLPKPKNFPVTLKEIRKPRQTPPAKKMRSE